MEKELQNELLQAIKEDNLYDFICNNYYLLSKEELKDLAKELCAIVFQPYQDEENKAKGEVLVENLKDYTTLLEEDL